MPRQGQGFKGSRFQGIKVSSYKHFSFSLFVLTLLIWLFGNGAFAYFPSPALSGASGLTRIPDATVIPYKNWNIAADYGTKTDSAGVSKTTFSYKSSLGAFYNMELGFIGQLDETTQQLKDGVYINLKYSPSLGDGTDPLLLAIGIENLASKTQTALYMVATKPLKQGPFLSFGFMADFVSSKFRPMGMAGIDFPIGSISILSDLFLGESVFQVNGGVRFRILPTFVIEGRAINILSDESPSSLRAKDSRQVLFGINWINPFSKSSI